MSSLYSSPVECNLAETSFADICATEVYEELRALDTTKAKGIDGIVPVVLKPCAKAFVPTFMPSICTKCQATQNPCRVEASRDYTNPQVR